MPSMPRHYRDTFDPTRNRTRLLASEDKYFYAQDWNESLSMERHARSGLADAIFRDGEVVRGAQILVEIGEAVAHATLEAGQVYVHGQMRDLAATGFDIPKAGDVLVGVVLETRVITSLEDPTLKFQNFEDLAFESHGMPRQAQLEEKPRWGASTEALVDTPSVGYSFFPVYTVRDGVVVDTSPPTEAGAFVQLVERYDRESNGHYIARGCKLSYLETAAGAQIYSLAEGVVNVEGRKIDRPASVRLTYVEDPDFERINAEPHLFDDGGTGTFVITLNRTPVAVIHDVSVLTEKTVTVTRGQSTGGRDALPDSQIQQIMSVVQGGTTYTSPASYNRLGDEVDWSPGGAEPAPGSTYQVTYRYKKSIAPTASTETTVTVTGAVTGSEVDIDYSWKMPRFDVIAIDKANAVHRIKGVASPYNPQRPRIPAYLLELAQIEQRWTSDYPRVRQTGVQAVPIADMELMRGAIIENRQELARIRLQTEASARNPAAINGIFADNFENDAQRDAGIEQSASIVDGRLTLSIAATLANVNAGGDGWSLSYALEEAIVQPLRTRALKINPYQSFDPVPAAVRLTPSVDEWVDVETQWASAITRTLTSIGRRRATETSEELLASTSAEAQFIRQREVAFAISGFGSGELLQSLTFDGVDVTPAPAPAANPAGELSGIFDVPANIPVGTKTVVALGAGGSMGTADYTGRGTITIEERRRVTTVYQKVDPVFQSFTPAEGFHLGGWRFRFSAIGNRDEPVVVQLREAVQGQPARTVIAEAVIDMQTATTEADTVALFPTLPWCETDGERTIVWLTNDPDHAIAVAELGKFDPYLQRWVTQQAYQVGVCGGSSNNRAWTIYQELDVYFAALKAKFTEASRTVTLGTIAAENVTDILALAGVEIPTAATGVDLIFERPNGEQIKVAPGAVVSLDKTLNEDLIVKAVLRGVPNASPHLFPDPQVVLGALSSIDNYVSRAFPCGNDRKVRAEARARLPGASTLEIGISDDGATETELVLVSTADDGDGWTKYVYEVEEYSAEAIRAHVTLSGSALHRPEVDSLVVLPLAV
ncbi:DUF4815 domain-containing protein [Shinella sp. JR1-6]|uniref:DUF4815 domain-containing protein n=1 Tax=Shinella sp. JR1-6 TaxID=2527671 RepID=UPI00102D5C5A|nr:DUF4815 domain-containing protein [Shinella sp. JR1-6]TAA54813.1 DUF4815 domain-containing protein [Shinella sp. JR1-6]